MGLDMYLRKKTYVKNWQHTPEDEKYQISITRGGYATSIDTDRVGFITEEIGYWRKANQIHNWFVENVQEGIDQCQPAFVSRPHLANLLSTVNTVLDASELIDGKVKLGERYKDGKWEAEYADGKVIKDPTIAKELLPTTSGFFFGSEEYDERYYEQLVETKQILEDALSDPEADDFEYESSW